MKRTFYKDMEQSSDEWRIARCGIVTASTMRNLVTATGKPADNDVSRKFVQQLATERIIGVPEYTYPTRPMRRGNLLEPYARDLYAEHYATVEEVGFIRLDTDEYSLGYSPDGLVGHDGLIEIKSPGPKEHLRTIVDDAEMPKIYTWQVQVGLFVTGRAWLDFISYCPGMDLFVNRIYPDVEMHRTISEAVFNAETSINALVDVYERWGKDRVKTEYFDPFEEEEITF